MRKVSIEDDGQVLDVLDGGWLSCPMIYGDKGRGYCLSNCAWFNIQTHFKNDGEDKVAYCGDKIIGEIAE